MGKGMSREAGMATVSDPSTSPSEGNINAYTQERYLKQQCLLRSA